MFAYIFVLFVFNFFSISSGGGYSFVTVAIDIAFKLVALVAMCN